MPNTPPPPVRDGEADEDILSISQEEFVPAHAPATHPQVLDDLFTPPAFLLARDVRREVKDLALHAPAQAPTPQTAPVRPAAPARQQASVEVAGESAPVQRAVKPALVEAPVVSEVRSREAKAATHVRPANEARPAGELKPEPKPLSELVSASQRKESDAVDSPEVNRAVQRPEVKPEPARTAPQLDNYAVGLRLLRISPLWLVLSSVGFFLLIFLLSWLYQPAKQPEALTIASAAGRNHSVNQSAPAPAPAAATAVAPVVETAVPPAVTAESSAAEPAASAPAAKPAPAPQPELAALPADAPAAAPTGRFAVQVGSFNNSSEANERVSKLRASGVAARAVAVDIPQRGVWHRVYVGGFNTREEAARHASGLRAKGVAPAGLVVEVK